MNRRIFMTLSGALIAQAFAVRAFAGKQRFREGSLVVNVNNASPDELISIPEIGPELANAIRAHRPYKRLEDLLRVKGIGNCTLGSMIPYVKLEGKTEPYGREK
jgi:DNA uptake protein ComE-like DNA-binding protein